MRISSSPQPQLSVKQRTNTLLFSYRRRHISSSFVPASPPINLLISSTAMCLIACNIVSLNHFIFFERVINLVMSGHSSSSYHFLFRSQAPYSFSKLAIQTLFCAILRLDLAEKCPDSRTQSVSGRPQVAKQFAKDIDRQTP